MTELSKTMTTALVSMGEQTWNAYPLTVTFINAGAKIHRTDWNTRGSEVAITDRTMTALEKRGLVYVEYLFRLEQYEAQLTDAGRKLAAEIAASHIGEANDMV